MVELKNRFLVTAFFAVIGFVPVSQVVVEWTRGDRPVVAELVSNVPTEQHLRDVEDEIEETSWFARNSRSLAQNIWFRTVRGTRGKRLGRTRWLAVLSSHGPLPGRIIPTRQGPATRFPGSPGRPSSTFISQLAGRGIQLLVVPVPGKASIYPERVSSRADPEGIADLLAYAGVHLPIERRGDPNDRSL